MAKSFFTFYKSTCIYINVTFQFYFYLSKGVEKYYYCYQSIDWFLGLVPTCQRVSNFVPSGIEYFPDLSWSIR